MGTYETASDKQSGNKSKSAHAQTCTNNNEHAWWLRCFGGPFDLRAYRNTSRASAKILGCGIGWKKWPLCWLLWCFGLQVKDRNDHSPTFIFPRNNNNTVYTSYKNSPGTPIATILARDRDAGQNAKLWYFISAGDPQKLFEMDGDQGQLVIARKLTKRHIGRYRLTIEVKDSGDHPRAQHMDLIVAVNDSPPGRTLPGWPTLPKHESQAANGPHRSQSRPRHWTGGRRICFGRDLRHYYYLVAQSPFEWLSARW